jgi:hypothetical protein
MAPREALVPHLLATLRVDWGRPPDDVARLLGQVDAAPWRETGAHEAYLDEVDAPAHGDPAREARYRAGLAEVRALADAGAALEWEAMQRVQAAVLGAPAAFRDGPAFARGGDETYAWFAGVEAMFRRKVAVDGADGAHALVKACRLYLDVIFFHPFADGNARAARLWLEFLLRRARVPTPPLADLVRLPKVAGSPALPWTFVRLAAKRLLTAGAGACASPRRRRSAGSCSPPRRRAGRGASGSSP